jgi:hypothetical protein
MFDSNIFYLSSHRFDRLNNQKRITQLSKVDLISAYLFTAQMTYEKGQFFCLKGALIVVCADLPSNQIRISAGNSVSGFNIVCNIDKVLNALESMDRADKLTSDPTHFKPNFIKILENLP